jgi:hypothetical protein
MRKLMLFIGVALLGLGGQVLGQQDSVVRYRKIVAMISMRDGVKLFGL